LACEALGYVPVLSQANPLSEIGQRHRAGSFAAFDLTPAGERPNP
jgi:hypothetical protein